MTFTVSGFENLGEFNNLDVAIIVAEELGAYSIDEDDFTYWAQFVPKSRFWRRFTAYADDSFVTDYRVAFDKTF